MDHENMQEFGEEFMYPHDDIKRVSAMYSALVLEIDQCWWWSTKPEGPMNT